MMQSFLDFLLMMKESIDLSFLTHPLSLWLGICLCVWVAGKVIWWANGIRWCLEKDFLIKRWFISLVIGLPLSIILFKFAWDFPPFHPPLKGFLLVADEGAGVVINFIAFCISRFFLLIFPLSAIVLPPLMILRVITYPEIERQALAARSAKEARERQELIHTHGETQVVQRVTNPLPPAPPPPPPRSNRWKHRVNKASQEALPPQAE